MRIHSTRLTRWFAASRIWESLLDRPIRSTGERGFENPQRRSPSAGSGAFKPRLTPLEDRITPDSPGYVGTINFSHDPEAAFDFHLDPRKAFERLRKADRYKPGDPVAITLAPRRITTTERCQGFAAKNHSQCGSGRPLMRWCIGVPTLNP